MSDITFLWWMTHTAASYQPIVELSIICGANSNFVAGSKKKSGNHFYRQLLSWKISRIQNTTLKHNYAKTVLICAVTSNIFEIIEEHVNLL